MAKTSNKLPPVHPGEILNEDLMQPLGIETSDLALALRVPGLRLRRTIEGRRGIDTDMALRLARYFGVSEGFFLALQADHDLMERRRQIAPALKSIKPRTKAA